ncbi:MAG: response regulator [Candidatus Magnetomorum sp.]|nr:response regulator [Candidatus Magnetomorum sp.]
MKPNGKLLIVDEAQNTTSLEDVFRYQAYTIFSAFSGESALDKIHNETIDILITNMTLSDMDAMELIRYSKSIKPEIQCIVIADRSIDFQELDDIKLLKKPFHTDALSLLVKTMMETIPSCQILNKTVLLVEDTRFMLLTETNMLKEIGFANIVTASDGIQAIEKIQAPENDIGLIISDWNMPNKNGLEFLQWVRQNDSYKDIPFIMATSQAEKKQAGIAMDAGANNFLIKPFGVAELQKSVEDVLGKLKDNEKKELPKNLPRMTDSGKPRLFVGHIPITDHLILGVLKHFISIGKFNPKYFELETRRMLLWNPLQKALENGDVDAAFILAPIVMDIFNYGIGVKIVLLAHKNGSICVRNKMFDTVDVDHKTPGQFFQKKLFYLPHLLSVHHMLSDIYFRDLGLNPGYAGQEGVNVFYEVIPPIMMPDFQAKEKNVAGFMVAEPIGAKAIANNVGEKLILTSDIWNNHPCCVLSMRDEFIEKHADAAHEFVSMLIQAGQYIADEPKETAKIAADFLDPDQRLGFTSAILEKVLMDPKGIKTDNLIPVIDDFDRIQRYMHDQLGMGSIVNLEKLIDTRFI